MAFPEAWLNELMSRSDIVSVISEYTHLTSRGSRMWAKCPFHAERNASFTVSPDKQLFHCFSCKAGGSVIQFIMQAENLPYIDAIRYLARRAGMDMPEEIDDENLKRQKILRDRMYQANRDAARYFHSMLMSNAGDEAKRYLAGRGISGNTAVKFGLGYAPGDWDALYKYMLGKGYTKKELISAGLCVRDKKDENHAYDFFKNRLMFPVISAGGEVVAFGGRVLGGGEPKYMNTGDTLIYNKKHNVYAVNLLRGKHLGELIMVEGYMDVLTLHQHGIDNAVASLGTALTPQQVRLMSRFARKAYYAYDGDEAGQKAMLRGVDVLKANGMEPKVIVIPGGRDPDEFIRSFGAEAFLKLRDSAVTAVRFKLDTLEGAQDMNAPDGREAYAKQACALISALEPVERVRYIAYIAERSGLPREVIKKQCERSAGQSGGEDIEAQSYFTSGYRRPQPQTEREKAETLLLACLMTSRSAGAYIVRLKGFSQALFSVPSLADFARKLENVYKNGNEADIRMMIAGIDGAGSEGPSAAIAAAESLNDPVESAKDCIALILKTEYDERIREIGRLCKNETDPVKRASLLEEQMELMKKSRAIR